MNSEQNTASTQGTSSPSSAEELTQQGSKATKATRHDWSFEAIMRDKRAFEEKYYLDSSSSTSKPMADESRKPRVSVDNDMSITDQTSRGE
ncbi:uncharacterized protein IL334_007363 [Kwoniella shivajii]|uniref:Uncharacterized protein n=1 Tax=Kwoniella shivajii TaxID=564305 RepID=A0ABZ1D8Z0_9TREE|nr:hypothetical protein IL334_007363 [Kwoniella shivajii]